MKTLSIIALSLASVAANATNCGPQKATGPWDVQVSKSLLCSVVAAKPASNGIANVSSLVCSDASTVLAYGEVFVDKSCNISINLAFGMNERNWSSNFVGGLDKGKTVALGVSTLQQVNSEERRPYVEKTIATAIKK